MRAILPVLVGAFFAVGCGTAAGEGPGRAAVMFSDQCGTCHGDDGHGKPEIQAPGIAGLPEWYVVSQLYKFRSGVRGAHHADLEGLRMRPMSRVIPESDIKPIAEHVAALAPAPDETQRVGDADAGKTHYAACATCHGPEGKGMQPVGAPPIGLLPSWYIEGQLHKFRNGVRGAHPDDTHGKTMVPWAKSIPSDQAVTDLAAYVSSL